MSLLLDSVFALGQGIPQLDGFISGSTDNLTIIGGESNAQDIVAVILETAGGTSGGQVPQSQILIPRSGQGKVAVRGKDDIRNKVTMTMKALLGDSIVLFITSQLPNDEGFVTGRTQDDVRVLGIGSNLGNPAAVAFESSSELKCFSHSVNLIRASFSHKRIDVPI